MLSLLAGLILTAQAEMKTPHYNTPEIYAYASSSFEGTPLMKIASCESGNGNGSIAQYDDQGNVLTHFNKDKSFDLGILQINSIHLDEAAKMSLNLNNPQDNVTFGLWLFIKYGVGPWKASRTCWGA
jgi:hypothetical protein